MLRRFMIFVGILVLGTTASLAGLSGPFYIGASAAKTDLEVDDLGDSFDDSDTTYKVFAGYRFIKYFGLEAGYVDFGNFNDVGSGIDLSVDATAWELFAVGILPLGKYFELFGKYGYFNWDRHAEATGIVISDEEESGSSPVYGAGMAFVFGEHFAVRLEYEKYKMTDVESLSQQSAGLEFRF